MNIVTIEILTFDHNFSLRLLSPTEFILYKNLIFNHKCLSKNISIGFKENFSENKIFYERSVNSTRRYFSNLERNICNFCSIYILKSKMNYNLNYKTKPFIIYKKFSDLILVNKFKEYIEVVISFFPKNKNRWKNLDFKYLPNWIISSIGSYSNFNNLQLRLFPFVFASDSNILIVAPTGSGKTILIIFSILRLIVNSIKLKISNGKIIKKFLKAIYIAPMKALVKEIFRNIGNCFKNFGIVLYEVTGDTIVNLNELYFSNIIIGTPEKIENLLYGKKQIKAFGKIRLLIIDEVHFLREERGAVLENLLIYFTKKIFKKKNDLRIFALSATIPNFYDLSKFLGINIANGVFYFGDFIKEKNFNQIIIGLKTNSYNIYDLNLLNSILVQKTLYLLNLNKKARILIFVQSRKDTYKTASYLIKELKKNQDFLIQNKFNNTEKLFLKKIPIVLRKLFEIGIGIHHSGLSKKEKNFIENSFKSKILKVLITTSTLAWGVNLKTNYVIIKGTKIYSPSKSTWVEISGTNLVQMLGRAGRYDSGKNNINFLITMSKNVERYVKLIKNRTPVESTLLTKLPDYLNMEIASKRIENFGESLNWLTETFFWTRIRRLLLKNFSKIKNIYLKELQLIIKSFFISQALNELSTSGLIKIVVVKNFISSTVYGNISAFYHINYQIFLELISKLSPNKNFCQLLNLLSFSTEFKNFYPRKDENIELFRLSQIVSIPINVSCKTKEFKVNVLIQSYIENIRIKNNSLLSDCVYICKNALKLSRVIFELCIVKKWATMAQTSFDLYLAIKNRNWFYKDDYWQFIKGSIRKKYSDDLIKKNFSFFLIQNLKETEINGMINSKKGTMSVLKSSAFFPFFDSEFWIQPITRFTIKISVNLIFSRSTIEYFQKNYTGLWIFIEDQICDTLIYTKYLGLKDLSKPKDFNFSILIPIFENPISPCYLIKFKFDNHSILNTEYIIDLTEIFFPLNHPIETTVSKIQETSISRLMIGFKGSNSIKEYFLSHIVKLNRFISEHLSLILKAGQNKIIGSFNKKNKNFINEFSIINSFLTKKKFGIFFSNNGSDSTLLKVFQFQKSSNAILGIPIEKFSLNHYKYFFGGRKDKRIFIMKNIEIFSTLNHFENLKNNQIILIIDINTIISGLEVESSLELILELFFFKKNLKKVSSIVLSLSKILNMVDVIKILRLENLFKFCDSKISNLKNSLFFTPLGINLSLLESKKIKWKNTKSIQNVKLKKSLLIQKEVFFCLNLKSSLKKVKEFVINSGIFFYFDHNKISNENYVNFYISNNFILSKSQKFFISMGLGIHDFNLKLKKRKFIEELDLIGFFQKYWVSISSISKIAMERFFHLKGVLNGLFFIRNQIKFSSFIFNVLSIHCDKIIFCSNKYLSRNILKNSFDFPLESSWKNLFLEKGNIILKNGKFDYSLKKVINQKLGFFFNRILNNPIFYLSTIKNKKKSKKKKINCYPAPKTKKI